jgi:hypothetical protein
MSLSDDDDATLKMAWTQYIIGVARNLYNVVFIYLSICGSTVLC